MSALGCVWLFVDCGCINTGVMKGYLKLIVYCLFDITINGKNIEG
jgi:hypothetical protein